MHPVFRIPELVELIVLNAAVPAHDYGHLRRGRQKQILHLDYTTRRDLISLGLTSKIFLEHVLDVLWHTQKNLKHLLRIAGVQEYRSVSQFADRVIQVCSNFSCLHPGAVQIQICVFQPTRAITEEDCHTMLPYSSRVRAFNMGREDRVSFSEEDVRTVQTWREVLFPRLRALYVKPMGARDIEFILAGRSDLLTDLESDWAPLSESLLEAVRWRPLTKLVLLSVHSAQTHRDPAAVEPLILILRQTPNLTELSLIAHFVPQLWEAAASLPALQSYHFEHTGSDLSFLPTVSTPFVSLFKLSFFVHDIASATLCLQRCALPRLQELECSIETSYTASRQEVSALVDAIHTACHGAHDLVGLKLEAGCTPRSPSEESDGTPEDLDKATLKSFFRYRHMQHFVLNTKWFWAYDDAFIREAAVAWPQIQVLDLDPRAWSDSQISLDGLMPLARRCPQLQFLGAQINTARLPPICPPVTISSLAASTRTKPWKGQTALVTLNVGTSTISWPPRKIADYLAYLFPALQNVEAYYTDDPDELMGLDDTADCIIWDRVGKILAGEDTNYSEDEGSIVTDEDESEDDDSDSAVQDYGND